MNLRDILINAFLGNNIADVQNLMGSEQWDSENNDLLLLSIHNISTDILLFFAERGLDLNFSLVQSRLNQTSEFKETLLFAAVMANRHGVASMLIDQGVDVNFENSEHASAFLYVCYNHDIRLLRKLLRAGVNVHYMSRGGRETALTVATKHVLQTTTLPQGSSRLKTIKLLLANQVDFTQRNKDNKTCLHNAVEQLDENAEKRAIVKLLMHKHKGLQLKESLATAVALRSFKLPVLLVTLIQEQLTLFNFTTLHERWQIAKKVKDQQ